jgi:hypothetical protein
MQGLCAENHSIKFIRRMEFDGKVFVFANAGRRNEFPR